MSPLGSALILGETRPANKREVKGDPLMFCFFNPRSIQGSLNRAIKRIIAGV